MVLEAVNQNGHALGYASVELQKKLAVDIKASLQAHHDFAFVLHGTRPQPAPAAGETLSQEFQMHELPLRMINSHGYFHGVVMLRHVANFAGAAFGHAFVLQRKAAQNSNGPFK